MTLPFLLLTNLLSLFTPADRDFLADQARRMVQSARLAPGQVSGKWKNRTPYAMCVPGGNLGYPAFWVRDAVMMLDGDLVPASEVEGWIRLMAATVRDRDWQVRPGVVVPAWAIPDHINFDGRPVYYPGTYDSGTKQGGGPYGKYPPLDDHFYFIAAVHEHWRMTRDPALFRSKVAAAFGEARLSELCERAYRVAPADPSTGLVTAGDPDTEGAKDFGFCDTVFKSGRLLFPSLLKLDAARRLAELFDSCGESAKAHACRRDAGRLRKAIAVTFARPSGWLHSATGVGNQPDVFGSAYAVWLDALEDPGPVGRTLVRAFRDGTAVRDGCVRHLPSGFWERTGAKPGEYQNGGYWGTATGWYIAAMARVDRRAAADMARDYVAFLRRELRPDGLSRAWEWFNPETGKRSNELYVATVALPYLTLAASRAARQPSRSAGAMGLP